MNTTEQKLSEIAETIEKLRGHLAECESALLEIAQKARGGRPPTKKGTLAELCSIVAKEFGTEASAIRGTSQIRFLTMARNAFSLLAHEHTGHSYPSIARFLRRHHVSVMSGARRAQGLRVTQQRYGAQVSACEAKFTQVTSTDSGS